MNQPTTEANSTVPPEEVKRRIAEYRRICFERKLPAQVVYHGVNAPCPWPGCGLRILGIRFELELLGDATQVSRWMDAWWNGPGLIGRCPHCRQNVLFDVTSKQAVTGPAPPGAGVLPEDWHEKAHVVVRPE